MKIHTSWLKLIIRVLGDLGPPVFNAFFADLFFMVNNMNLAVYANENIPHLATDCANNFIKYLA